MKLFLLGMEHECAKRVLDKPLRPFAGTTLFDIYLKKFQALKDCDLFSGQGIALWPGDKRLWAKAEAAGVPIIERSEASAKGHGDYKVVFEFLKEIEADYVLRLSTCAPFLEASRIRTLAQWHSDLPADWATVHEVRKWVWRETEMLGHRATTSQDMEPLRLCTHGALIFRPTTLLDSGWPWGTLPVQHMGGMPVISTLDIDTEADFDLARRVAESFTEEEWAALYTLPTS